MSRKGDVNNEKNDFKNNKKLLRYNQIDTELRCTKTMIKTPNFHADLQLNVPLDTKPVISEMCFPDKRTTVMS